MKHSKENPILHELFGGEDVRNLRVSSLEAGLVALRRKRTRHRIGQTALFVPALLALALVLRTAVHDKSNSPASAEKSSAAGFKEGSTKMISERELFALFPNRPMAVVGKPGHQQVVFLDQLPIQSD